MRAYIQFYWWKNAKKYSSKIELKSLALRFADKNNFEQETISRFLVEVDRLKSNGALSDGEILIKAIQKIEV